MAIIRIDNSIFMRVIFTLFILSIYSFGFSWDDIDQIQCRPNKTNWSFSTYPVQTEIDLALKSTSEKKRNLHFSNAIEFSRGVPRDQFCLTQLFNSFEYSYLASQSKQLFYRSFANAGGIHSQKIHDAIYPNKVASEFLFTPSSMSMVEFHYDSLRGLLTKGLRWSAFFFTLWGLLAVLLIYLIYSNGMRVWTNWGIKKPMSGALSSAFILLIFALLNLYDIRLACIALLLFLKPSLNLKFQIIACFSLLMICIGDYSLTLSNQIVPDLSEDSNYQIDQAIWAPVNDTLSSSGPLSRSISAFKKGQYSLAMTEIEKFEYLHPQSFWPYTIQAAIHFAQGHHDASLELLRKGFDRGLPEDVFYYNTHLIYNSQRRAEAFQDEKEEYLSKRLKFQHHFLETLHPTLRKKAALNFLLPTTSFKENLKELFPWRHLLIPTWPGVSIMIIGFIMLFIPWHQFLDRKARILQVREIRNNLIHYRRRKQLSHVLRLGISPLINYESFVFSILRTGALALLISATSFFITYNIWYSLFCFILLACWYFWNIQSSLKEEI